MLKKFWCRTALVGIALCLLASTPLLAGEEGGGGGGGGNRGGGGGGGYVGARGNDDRDRPVMKDRRGGRHNDDRGWKRGHRGDWHPVYGWASGPGRPWGYRHHPHYVQNYYRYYQTPRYVGTGQDIYYYQKPYYRQHPHYQRYWAPSVQAKPGLNIVIAPPLLPRLMFSIGG